MTKRKSRVKHLPQSLLFRRDDNPSITSLFAWHSQRDELRGNMNCAINIEFSSIHFIRLFKFFTNNIFTS